VSSVRHLGSASSCFLRAARWRQRGMSQPEVGGRQLTQGQGQGRSAQPHSHTTHNPTTRNPTITTTAPASPTTPTPALPWPWRVSCIFAPPPVFHLYPACISRVRVNPTVQNFGDTRVVNPSTDDDKFTPTKHLTPPSTTAAIQPAQRPRTDDHIKYRRGFPGIQK